MGTVVVAAGLQGLKILYGFICTANYYILIYLKVAFDFVKRNKTHQVVMMIEIGIFFHCHISISFNKCYCIRTHRSMPLVYKNFWMQALTWSIWDIKLLWGLTLKSAPLPCNTWSLQTWRWMNRIEWC